MQFSSFLLFAALAVSIARCAPALDAATLSDNAKKAQELNAKFLTLKATDPCQGQETACLNGNIATCVDGKFDTSDGQCQESQECFAIPNIRAPGTSLLCTSENTVLGLITAAGGKGGITGSDKSIDGPNNSTTSSSTSSSTSTSTSLSPSSSGSPNDEPKTVTVTVFASPLSSTTTTTVSPSDASSILNKFLTDGQPPPTSTSGPTPAAESSSTPPASLSGSSISSSGTPSAIPLAAGGDSTPPSPSPNASPAVIQLTALPEEPSPSTPTPTPSPDGVPVGGGGGGGGYGY